MGTLMPNMPQRQEEIDTSRLTPPYMAGFMDSSKCFVTLDPPGVHIKFPASVALLRAFQTQHGGTLIDSTLSWTTQDDMKRMLNVIEPFSFARKRHIAMTIEYGRESCTANRKREIEQYFARLT